MRLGLSGLVLLLSSSAFAQEPPPTYVAGAVPDPNQSVLPNTLATRKGLTLDLRMDYTHFDANDFVDATVLGFTLHGQWLTPENFGGYASIPFGYISTEDDGLGGESNSESGIGNIELGGLYAIRSPGSDILLRGGLAIDTADEEDAGLVVASQLSPRLNDAYTVGLETTWARLQAQMRHASGGVVFGGSLGFDLPISGELSDSDGFDGLFNVAVSVGLDNPGFGLGVGLVMIHALTEGDDDDDTIWGLNATIDFPVGTNTRLYGSLGIPEIEDLDENESDLFAIGIGARVGLK